MKLSSCFFVLAAFLAVEAELPLFYGWFLNDINAYWLENESRITFKTLSLVPEVRSEMLKYFYNVTSGADLNSYYSDSRQSPIALHVTAMFCGRGKVPECSIYSQKPAVQTALGRSDFIEIVGFLITPNTLGARVRITDTQLPLWAQNDAEGGCKTHSAPCYQKCCNDLDLGISSKTDPFNFQPTIGIGSRGHVTLGCAKGVSAVTTGLDLVDIIQCEQKCPHDRAHFDNFDQEVRYYGEGRFFVYPKRRMFVQTEFNFYS